MTKAPFIPNCPVCGAAGSRVVYDALTDQLFGAQGSWTLVQCVATGCGLYRLHPIPTAEELASAYANYYTHEAKGNGTRRGGRLRAAYGELVSGYLRHRFGYPYSVTRGHWGALWPLLYLAPLRRAGLERSLMWLPFAGPQRLLDVGCGSGEWLERMKALGWNVEGIDPDAEAVLAARRTGCQAQCGTLPDIAYPSGHFDVVSMNHVIEHVPDPLGTLRECLRILRPGGQLVLATPNGASWGHRLFGARWRGLEPPRHLHLFGCRSMERLLQAAGFVRPYVRTYAARSVVEESISPPFRGQAPKMGALRRRVVRSLSWALTAVEHVLLALYPRAGECIFAHAAKPSR